MTSEESADRPHRSLRERRLRELLRRILKVVEFRLGGTLAANRSVPPEGTWDTSVEAGLVLLDDRARESEAEEWEALCEEVRRVRGKGALEITDGDILGPPAAAFESGDEHAWWRDYRKSLLERARTSPDQGDMREATGLIRDTFGESTAERFSTEYIRYCDAHNGAIDALLNGPVWLQPPYHVADDAARAVTAFIRDLLADLPAPAPQTTSDGLPVAGVTDGASAATKAVEGADSLRLEPAVEKAWIAYQYAEHAASRELTDKEAWERLREDCPVEYALPDCETFARYLRTARKAHGTPKNAPRAGRSGRSIARADER